MLRAATKRESTQRGRAGGGSWSRWFGGVLGVVLGVVSGAAGGAWEAQAWKGGATKRGEVGGKNSTPEELRGYMVEDGIFSVNVPHYGRNPWDLLIADHASHFDAGSLRRLLQSGGFEPLELHKNRIPLWCAPARPAKWSTPRAFQPPAPSSPCTVSKSAAP